MDSTALKFTRFELTRDPLTRIFGLHSLSIELMLFKKLESAYERNNYDFRNNPAYYDLIHVVWSCSLDCMDKQD